MDGHDRESAQRTTTEAARLREHATAAGRWYGGYLLFLGVASAGLLILTDAASPDGFGQGLAAGGWFVTVMLVSVWAQRRRAFPAGAARATALANAVWFGSYLVVVGPLVRWRYQDSPLAWAPAAAAMSMPFAAAALLVGRTGR
ncbi:hypothetical protein [Nocardiopsis alborubida]|uniref:Uncharacterized protein n=1 Tax=Nocardiopsis alborubida TaxID=146802 RepID=A0A7X6M8U2_9ACTN|nr:hypothetical protein [Nocardiopsis alborubida]NKY96500.1 hypothetical protein [Nocardiopsis alborubida]